MQFRCQMRAFDPSQLTAAQLRAARALLNWSAVDLAQAAKVGVATVRRAEPHEGCVRMRTASVERVVATLQNAGVLFIPASGPNGAGVRLVGDTQFRAIATTTPTSHSSDVTS